MHYVRDGLVSAGSSLLVAALVALTAAGGVNTWIAERTRARELNARSTYETLAAGLMGRFSPSEESTVRAKVATWASPLVVIALGEWNAAYDRNVAPTATGTVTLDAAGEGEMRDATVAVIAAIREEIGLSPQHKAISNALFNRSSPGEAPGQSGM